jgi:HAD superfamily hydrolase (TIGR01509 family)
MIKGIFFDAAGVLYHRQEHTANFAVKLLQEMGYTREVSAGDIERLDALRLQASQGMVDHDAYWDLFLSLRGVTDAPLRRQYISRIVDFSNDVQPVPGGREALAGLKQRGYALGVVTDTMYPLAWKMRRLEKVGVAEFIDVIACSTDLGVHKPDPAMYLNAIRQLKLLPPESAFVGHLAVELEGARRAGMTTVAVNYDPDAQADYFCDSLLDLLTLSIFSDRVIINI